jgi:hypothetical protein
MRGMINEFGCPICGYSMEDPPTAYNICPCCGTEFDHTVASRHRQLREEWLKFGARWWSPVDQPPLGWNPYVQMLRAGLLSRPLTQATSADQLSGPQLYKRPIAA